MDAERLDRLLLMGCRYYRDLLGRVTSTATTHEDIMERMGLEPGDLAPYIECTREGTMATLTMRDPEGILGSIFGPLPE